MAGDTPNIQYGAQVDYKKLYYSNPLAALKIPIFIQAGYGELDMGTFLSKNLSASSSNAGKKLPYNPTTFTGDVPAMGRAFLVADTEGGISVDVYVTQDNSYKFIVGDDLVVNSDGVAVQNLGAITAIDRTSERQRAKITTAATITGTHTTGNSAYVCVEAGISTNNYSDAVGILEKAVDTGTGSTAQGADATMIWGNCVLYVGVIENNDSAGRTDISATVDGQYLMIR